MSDISRGVSPRTKFNWLAIYFTFNFALTLFNNTVLKAFPFPYVLTSVQTFFGVLGGFILERRGTFTLTRLTSKENITLLFFSFLYTINIAVSNLSLKLVTVPFSQAVKATTPVFALGLNVVLYQSSYPLLTHMSLLLVVAGVGFATYGDYYFKPMGFFLTLLSAFFTALKTVIDNRILTGKLKLSPLELLYRVSSLALAQTLIYAYFTGEISTIYNTLNGETTSLEGLASFAKFEPSSTLLINLALNGIIAFGLGVISLTANKNTGALTMTVASNFKQAIIIMLATCFLSLNISSTNWLGIVLTLIGGGLYVKYELDSKQNDPSLLDRSDANTIELRNSRKE